MGYTLIHGQALTVRAVVAAGFYQNTVLGLYSLFLRILVGLFEVTGLCSYSSMRITGDDKSAPPSCKLANLTRSCFQWALGGVCGVVLDWLLAEPMKTENRVELTEQHWALGSIAEIM